MKLHAPAGGELEWRSDAGEQVRAGQALGWITAPERCGLIPVTAPEAGRLSWRRSHLRGAVQAGEVVAAIGEAELGPERAAERAALERELSRLREDPLPGASSPLAEHLLGQERAVRARRIAALEEALAAQPAQTRPNKRPISAP